MKTSCEWIQNLGKNLDPLGTRTIAPEDALEAITIVIKRVKAEYKEAEAWFMEFYGPVLKSSE